MAPAAPAPPAAGCGSALSSPRIPAEPPPIPAPPPSGTEGSLLRNGSDPGAPAVAFDAEDGVELSEEAEACTPATAGLLCRLLETCVPSALCSTPGKSRVRGVLKRLGGEAFLEPDIREINSAVRRGSGLDPAGLPWRARLETVHRENCVLWATRSLRGSRHGARCRDHHRAAHEAIE